jgi:hypothetical protein
MIYHYPRWLLVTALGFLIASCYAWISTHQWPLASYAVGSTILVAFLLQSNAFLTDETTRLDKNQRGLINSIGSIMRHLRIASPDDLAPAAPVAPVVIPPGASVPGDGTIPIPVPVKLDVEDRRERALNTEATLKAVDSVERLRETIERTNEKQ